MNEINEGKFCGVCHGTVAFPQAELQPVPFETGKITGSFLLKREKTSFVRKIISFNAETVGPFKKVETQRRTLSHAKPPSSQRKAISFGFKNQDLKIFFASFAALREMPFASAFGSGLPRFRGIRL